MVNPSAWDEAYAEVAALELQSLFGGFAGEPFTQDSREYVFVVHRPDEGAS